MTKKNWIAILLSVVIALLYSLPWLMVGDQPRLVSRFDNADVGPRVLYLFVTVFATSIVLFQWNFFFRKQLAQKPLVIRIAMQVLLQVVAVIGCTAILLLVGSFVLEIKAVRAYFIFYLLRNLFLAAIIWLLTYVIELMEKLKFERMEVLMLENKNTESELSALRSQIDPHFFFNTLSTLGSLISPTNKQAVLFLENMSDTFRYTMEKRSSTLVTLREELEFMKSYLYMMNCRFGDSIKLTIDIGQDQTERLPQFALQIAVENAIKHNIVSSAYPLYIEMFRNDGRLTIRNSLRKTGKVTSHGIGLSNLAKRYALLGRHELEIRRTETHFELSLPLL